MFKIVLSSQQPDLKILELFILNYYCIVVSEKRTIHNFFPRNFIYLATWIARIRRGGRGGGVKLNISRACSIDRIPECELSLLILSKRSCDPHSYYTISRGILQAHQSGSESFSPIDREYRSFRGGVCWRVEGGDCWVCTNPELFSTGIIIIIIMIIKRVSV